MKSKFPTELIASLLLIVIRYVAVILQLETEFIYASA